MESLEDRIDASIRLRQCASEAIAKVLRDNPGLSEVEFCNELAKGFFTGEKVHKEGWYNPPPLGISALFCNERDTKRTYFTTLRNEEYWPKEQNFYTKESLGFIYASPVDIETGMIGDTGLMFYNGKDEEILNHLRQSFKINEMVAEYAEVGMSFGELNSYCRKLMTECGYNIPYWVSTTDKLIHNIGHTVPWSYEEPSEEEQRIIKGHDFQLLKDTISKKRIFLNAGEEFKIPKTICFTVEIRAEDKARPHLPATYSHLMVAFKDGKKQIIGGFDPILQAAGMSGSMESKYH